MKRHVEPPMTVPEVAIEMGWEYQRTLRTLHALDDELHGMLLRRERGHGRGVRYTVTRAALKSVRPEWFEDTRPLGDDVYDLRKQFEVLEKNQAMTATAVGQLFRKLEGLLSRISKNALRTQIP
jgi:hypothetical protein